ncbi:type II toxin-antitoxin system death-on-curing family toxin [Natribacillus halophilus]|uniref:Death on curing protein n=1 Tax=Natribacillus halophilus TaxID=549003 RepID=A0A1G8SRG7_9BACI|nr:type II toxin-antitoxin system death-on-curing family toxin [Natribacillus halophilus]SDJ31821.1 death on curing protein [Natribacillus halophilus]
MSAEFLRVDPEDVRYLHEEALNEYGGSSGENEPGLIDYMCEKPFMVLFGQEAYTNVFAKAAVLLEGFATHQYFSDGNKRTAAKSCLTFLAINGYELLVSDVELFEFTLRVAEKAVEIKDIELWLCRNTQESYFMFK